MGAIQVRTPRQTGLEHVEYQGDQPHSDGSYLLVSYPQGEPAAFAVEGEADLIKQAHGGAFANPIDEAASGNGSATPEHKTLGTKQVQP